MGGTTQDDEAAKAQPKAPAITDTTAEFEEYTAPPRLDEQGRPISKSKGLAAAGYQFPPPGTAAGAPPPLTKANLAKGIGVPEVPRAAPAPARAASPVPPVPSATPGLARTAPPPVERPPAVKVDEGELFEEYQRPDYRPRTGKGIRSEPPPKPGEPEGPRAKDILSRIAEPDLQVFTPKRFSPYQVKPSDEAKAPHHHPEHEKAALDAAADLAVHRKWLEAATMSSPQAGPIKAVIDHGAGDQDPVRISQPALSPDQAPVPISPEPSMDTSLPPDARLAAAAPTSMSRAPVIDVPRPVQAPYVPPAPTVQMHTPYPIARVPHASGAPSATPGGDVPRLAIVQSDFHFDITTRMAQAAIDKARALGAPVVHHAHVPGAFDIPLAAQALLERGDVDAVVCLGAIVQGETGHDTLIARECARALVDLALRLRKPVGFGVTGPAMTREQAMARVPSGAYAVESAVLQHRALKQASA